MNILKRIKTELKYKLQQFRWMKALFSPFKRPSIRWYVGKTEVGVPYFLPRKWVKATPKLATKAALEEIERAEKFNAKHPNVTFKHTVRTFKEAYDDKMKNSTFPVPLTIGFSYCGLGWKIKWGDHDYRHEWNPVFSFVFFGYQIAATITFKECHDCMYWECWLCYEYSTDKTKSKKERIAECRKLLPQIWTTRSKDDGTSIEETDYYNIILKPKYLKK
jgi:hypothetical protein